MRNVTLALIAVAVLAIAGGTQAALRRAEGQAPSQDGKSQFKLGVVNLKVCFDKDRYKRVKDIDAELEKKREEFEKKVRDIENHISELNSKLDSLPRDNSLRPEIYLQLGRAQSDRKFEQEYGRTMFLRFYSDRKTDVYNDIRRAVTSVAEAQKFDLVLRVEAPMLEEQDPESVSQRINYRVVLYHHNSVDITDAVVDKLNEEWAKKKAEPPPEWECPICKKKNKASDATCTATKDCKGKKP